MENILEIYKQPYDEAYPVVCMDESSKQHLRETREKLPMEPEKPERYDTEYERNGTSNLFIFFEGYVIVNCWSLLTPNAANKKVWGVKGNFT